MVDIPPVRSTLDDRRPSFSAYDKPKASYGQRHHDE